MPVLTLNKFILFLGWEGFNHIAYLAQEPVVACFKLLWFGVWHLFAFFQLGFSGFVFGDFSLDKFVCLAFWVDVCIPRAFFKQLDQSGVLYELEMSGNDQNSQKIKIQENRIYLFK